MSEATQAVLGSMIEDNECIAEVAEKITVDMFDNMNDRYIWNAILALDSSGTTIDLLTLRDCLKAEVSTEYVISCAESVVSSASVGYYSDIVLEDHRKAEVGRLASDLTRIASGDGTASELVVAADKAFRDRTEFDEKQEEHIADIVKKVKFIKGDSNRIQTGLTAIDDIIVGIESTDYVIMSGRPGMGKTSAMVDICTSMSGIRGIPVAFYSCEMSPQQIVRRMCSAISEVPLSRIEKCNGDYALDDDITNLEKAARQISSCPMYIKSAGGITPSKLKRMIANDKRKYGVKVAFVDHLHLMMADKPTGNPYTDLTSISRSTKQTILQTGVPIVMGCQLSRTEDAKEPKLTDLRGTGAIEEDADIVIGIHRPSYWTMTPDIETFFHVLKGRHFGTGVGEAEFHGAITSFRNKS